MTAWSDAALDPSVRAAALLDAATTRGAVKRLGAWIDAHGDVTLRVALLALGAKRGADVSPEDADLPGKTLIRLCLHRADEAQVRTTPIHRDEAFTCAGCGAEVPAHGRTARDHCPFCLRSVHVDVVPGDRAADCGGLLEPVGVELRGGRTILRYRCARCGASRVNQAILDGDVPDDWAVITALSAR